MPHLKTGEKPTLESVATGPGFATGGTKKCVKCTFGEAPRFNYKGLSQSPSKDLYYAHSKIWDAESYLGMSRSASMGGGQRCDMGADQHTASPASYNYERYTSSAKKSSPIDGFADRRVSPVKFYARR